MGKNIILRYGLGALCTWGLILNLLAEKMVPAELDSPVKELVIKCSICDGRGSYIARPPDLDQHRGTLDSREHWDIKIKTCPFCEGKGKRMVYDLTRRPLRSEVIPCKRCGWNGIRLCTHCAATGLLKCKGRDCTNGWIIHKAKGRKSTRRADAVDICPECSGMGKIICPFCRGMRAEICSRCNGVGRDLEKEAKERERILREKQRMKEREEKAAERAAREAEKRARRNKD